MAELSPVESDQEKRLVALDALVAALAADEDVIDLMEQVRVGEISAGSIARRVPRTRVGRRAIERLLAVDPLEFEADLLAGLTEREATRAAIFNAGRDALNCAEPVGRRRRYRRGQRHSEAAEMAADLIVGRCMAPGCSQQLSDGRLYCSKDASRAAFNQEADLEAVRHLLERAAAGLAQE